MPINYSSKVNERPIGMELSIVGEGHTVGIIGVGTVLANTVKLIEVPLQSVPTSTVIIPGFTETTNPAPGIGFFYVDYVNGYVTFNATANGFPITASYLGRGSEIDAVDINELQSPVGVALNYDGSLTTGIVKPASISTTITDNFTFPNDVTVNGDLTVLGTTTTVESATVTFEDPVLLLNYNNPMSLTKAGFEVLRDGASITINSVTDGTHLVVNSTAGINPGYAITQGPVVTSVTTVTDGTHLVVESTTGFVAGVAKFYPTVKMVWNESLLAWVFEDTAGNPILQAFGAGPNDGNVTITGVCSAASFSGPLVTSSITSTGSITYTIDSGSLNPTSKHIFQRDTNVILATINETGDFEVINNLIADNNVVADVAVQSDLVQGRTGNLLLKPFANTVSAIQLQSTGGTTVLDVDTTNLRVGINNSAPTVALDVTGATKSSTTVTAGTDLVATVKVDSDLVQGRTGNLALAPFADTITGIKLTNAAGSTVVLNVDTTNFRVGINNSAPTVALDVMGAAHTSSDTTVDTKVNTNQVTGRTGSLTLNPFSDSTTAVLIKNAAASSTVVTVDTTNLRLGINATPDATFHNAGSTVLGLTTATNPGSITTAQVDNNSGIVITTSAPVTVTLPTPTITTSGRFFTVLHKETSTGTLNVNAQNIGVGKGATYMWDGTAWVAVGATGGFQVMAGDPASPVTGDTWFDTVTAQFKGYNGTNNVILG